MAKPKVSIIIPTYNEEKVISRCLESLQKQTYKDFEIILVDDGSTDQTLHILQAFKEKDKRIKVLSQPHGGPGPARNLGASIAEGEVLVFVDSDMTFLETFLGELSGPIFEGRTNGTFSKLEYVANPKNIWSRCWGINEGWREGMRHPADYPDKQKVFRAILKSEFEKVGGFSSTGYTDDWTLSEKLGYEAESAKGVFYHENPGTLGEVFKQAKWIGKRRYKLGPVGKLVAMVRASLPVSLAIGMWKSIVNLNPAFLIFKIVYDAGVFVGALTSLFGGGSAK